MFNGFNRKSLAEYLGASLRHIEDLDARREGPPRVQIAGKWRYPKAGVENWLRAKTETQVNAPDTCDGDQVRRL